MPVEGYIKKKQNLDNSGQKDNKQVVTNKAVDFTQIKVALTNKVRERIIEKYTMDDLNDPTKMDLITKEALNLIEEEISNLPGTVFLDAQEKSLVLEKLLQNMFGFGVLDPLIKDPSITEIMVNGKDNIFIEKSGRIVIATNSKGENLKFDSAEELMYVIDKIVAPINRKVDDSNPIVDARLPNGFRVNIVLNVISLDGTIITIRKFPEHPFTMDLLVNKNSLPKEVADFLMKLVKARYNVFVSGGTGSGKTTFLNALSNYINKDERVITIEDAAELKITGIKNLIRLETRPPNVEGKGAITMRDLLKSALRMRPDRIVVGEVRSGEALEMLQAMNTGHDGSLSTGHANSAADMLARLETMVLMAGMELPLMSIRQQIATALDVIVHLGKLRDGTRRVLQITEMLGATSEGYITHDLFKFDPSANKLVYTGEKLQKTYKLKFSNQADDDARELGREVITTTYSLPTAIANEDSETTGLFQRFLQTKAPTEKTFKTESMAPKTVNVPLSSSNAEDNNSSLASLKNAAASSGSIDSLQRKELDFKDDFGDDLEDEFDSEPGAFDNEEDFSYTKPLASFAKTNIEKQAQEETESKKTSQKPQGQAKKASSGSSQRQSSAQANTAKRTRPAANSSSNKSSSGSGGLNIRDKLKGN